MNVLVCYDVSLSNEGAKRLRRVAQACKNFGVRVQNSVFECRLEEKDWIRLRHQLLSIFDPKLDSIRVYFLPEDALQKTEHHGTKEPVDPTGPLVL
jgi:CRISPR-associated protein Cas2